MDYLQQSLELLKKNNINSASTIEYKVNETIHTFKLYEIVESFMQASDEAQSIFYETLKKAVDENEVKVFFEKMGQLLIMSSLSEKFPE